MKEENYDLKPIWGHYHCKKCGCEMRPTKRFSWDSSGGVSHLHICPLCKGFFIEKEWSSSYKGISKAEKIFYSAYMLLCITGFVLFVLLLLK